MSESELVRQTSFGEVEGSWAIEEEQIGVFGVFLTLNRRLVH